MQIRKTLDNGEPVVQSTDETNEQVGNLFAQKDNLVSVTLTFADGSEPQVKLYERVEDEG